MCANLVTVAGDPSRAGVNGCFDDILEVLHTDKRIMAMCQLLQHNSFLLRGSSQLRSTEFHGSDPPPIVQQSDMSFWRIWSVYMAWTVVLTPPPRVPVHPGTRGSPGMLLLLPAPEGSGASADGACRLGKPWKTGGVREPFGTRVKGGVRLWTLA